MAGAFQTDSFWFLLDNGEDTAAERDDGSGTDDDFGRRLTGSGRLPALGRAPIASWVAARLARLVGGLPAWACDQHVDEGAYQLGLLVFDLDREHVGRAEVEADHRGVWVRCACPDAGEVLAELAAAFLVAPTDVAECRIEVREPEDEAECALQAIDPETHCRAVYGFERGAFLGGA